jgi:hypothetical protein
LLVVLLFLELGLERRELVLALLLDLLQPLFALGARELLQL